MKTHHPFTQIVVLRLLAVCAMLILGSSCNRNVLFTHSGTSAPSAAQDTGQVMIDKVLMPGDKISISVWDHEELSVGSVHNIYSVQEETGKWLMIDSQGEVNLPQVGTVKLQGQTLHDATIALQKLYSKLIQNPIINLRLLNNQVTVLGEVNRPGLYVFSSDNVRLTDVIGKASGFTDYAKTTKIRIIRSKNTLIVDLTSTSFSEMMLQPGDVVYVPPAGTKSLDKIAAKLIPFASLLTAVALVYNVSQKN